MSKKILFVEDDTFLQRMASKKLVDAGYEVESAIDGESALKLLDKEAPQLVLLDLLLPGVDGFEVLTRIKSDPKTKDVPVLVFSNLSEPEDIQRCMEIGIKGFVIKSSSTLNELVEQVQKTLS